MELLFPLSVTPTGSFGRTNDPSVYWKQRVIAVLATLSPTRAMRPSFGAMLPRTMFSTLDVAVAQIQSMVGEAFAKHLPSLSLQRVDVTEAADGSLVADVWYRLPAGNVDSTQIPVSRTMYGVVQ